jgi:hypothetical protein
MEVISDLTFLDDMWNMENLYAYLPKDQFEQDFDYSQRLSRIYWSTPFRRSIQGFAGLLTDFKTQDTNTSLESWIDDVDGRGNSLVAFLNDADELVLRDGFVGVMVDFPNTPVATRADELGVVRRPYMKLIDRRNIINYRLDFINGRQVPTLVVIKEYDWMPVNLYGEEKRERFRVIRGNGDYGVYELDSASKQSEPRLIDSGRYSVGRIPLVFYSLNNGNPPLMELAKVNLKYNQLYNDYLEIMRRCNLPVPVRKGVIDTSEPLILGGSVINLKADGDFYFAEPKGIAIGDTRRELERFETLMLQMAVGFAMTNQTVRTATETEFMAASTKASLKTLAVRKQSAVEQIFSLWSLWENKGEAGGSISINKNLLSAPLDPYSWTSLFR